MKLFQRNSNFLKGKVNIIEEQKSKTRFCLFKIFIMSSKLDILLRCKCQYLHFVLYIIVFVKVVWIVNIFNLRRLPEGSYKIESVRPSVHPSVQVFFWDCIIFFFLNFGMVLKTHMKLCMTELDFPEINFSLKNLKNEPKMGPDQGF